MVRVHYHPHLPNIMPEKLLTSETESLRQISIRDILPLATQIILRYFDLIQGKLSLLEELAQRAEISEQEQPNNNSFSY